ncbi:hypothetical protein CS544_07020 [Porphyromonas gingivalis]|nr:hypothetical protein CS544_07020 [Porphyromonas gingivalis]
MGSKGRVQPIEKQQQTTQNILRIHTSTRMPNAQASELCSGLIKVDNGLFGEDYRRSEKRGAGTFSFWFGK